jgi:hypothetical protein
MSFIFLNLDCCTPFREPTKCLLEPGYSQKIRSKLMSDNYKEAASQKFIMVESSLLEGLLSRLAVCDICKIALVRVKKQVIYAIV